MWIKKPGPNRVRAIPPDARADKLSDIPLQEEMAEITHGRRETALEPDDRSHPTPRRFARDLLRFDEVTSQWPLAEHHFAARERCHRHLAVMGNVDRDDNEVHFGTSQKIVVIIEREV